jgi:hypothetical protein
MLTQASPRRTRAICRDLVANTMTQTRLVIVTSMIGASGVLASIVIHGFAVMGIVVFGRRQLKAGRAGTGFWTDLVTVIVATMVAFNAHLIEIAIWTMLFWGSGEVSGLIANVHYAAANYTTLGTAEAPARSALLGPLAATDGMLMFGVSTAMLFAVIQRLLQTRYPDLRD